LRNFFATFAVKKLLTAKDAKDSAKTAKDSAFAEMPAMPTLEAAARPKDSRPEFAKKEKNFSSWLPLGTNVFLLPKGGNQSLGPE
jgi:hypothetical protein